MRAVSARAARTQVPLKPFRIDGAERGPVAGEIAAGVDASGGLGGAVRFAGGRRRSAKGGVEAA